MQNLLDNLKELLQKDERLVSAVPVGRQEGELLKNKIIELALKLDKNLIKLLLPDAKMKEVFFAEVGGALVFDKDKFLRFVSSKDFLPDSFTAFKNKIGLTIDGGYLSEKKEVVLSWPYKDCVLEGGMTKEDQKRDEIFWNETLAPDEISRLLDPKVFTNAKRIDAKGEHKFDKFRTGENGNIKDNLIIKGNNFLALHSLKKRFAGKIKLIYIDPPFNTGGDSFRYNDRFNHSSWLTFMKNRLEAARKLLADEGSIYVHLDHNELHYAKILMDEIFGRENFLNEVIWRYEGPQSPSDIKFATKHETILRYAKSISKLTTEEMYFAITKPVRETNYKKDEEGRYYYTTPKGDYSEDSIRKLEKEGRVYRTSSGNIRIKHFVDSDEFGNVIRRKKLSDVWTDITSLGLAAGSREKTDFSGQKPEALLQRITAASTNTGDVVLDFFAGTGTTGVVAHKMGRQYILVEQMEDQLKIMKERLQKVVAGEQGGISKSVGWQGGGDFVYLELMKWNENFVDKIRKVPSFAKASEGKKTLLKLWETMKEKAFLSYKVDVKAIDENAKDFADLSLEDQKKFLLECLDKNHLYVNYSEIEDEEYGVGKEDKKLNKEFYE